MSEFKNQQEVWAWLAAGNKCKVDGDVIGFKDGTLYDFTEKNHVCIGVFEYKKWSKYIEPVYEYQWLYKYKKPTHANTTSFFYKSEEDFLNCYIKEDLEWYERIERTKREVR